MFLFSFHTLKLNHSYHFKTLDTICQYLQPENGAYIIICKKNQVILLHYTFFIVSAPPDLCLRIIQMLTRQSGVFFIIFLSMPRCPAEKLMMNEQVVSCSRLSVSFIWVIKRMCVLCEWSWSLSWLRPCGVFAPLCKLFFSFSHTRRWGEVVVICGADKVTALKCLSGFTLYG